MKRRVAQFAGGLVLGVGLITGVLYMRGFDPFNDEPAADTAALVAQADSVPADADSSSVGAFEQSDDAGGDNVDVEDASENVSQTTSPDTTRVTADLVAAGADPTVATLDAPADDVERTGEVAFDRSRLIRVLGVMKPAEAARIVAELDDADAAAVLGALPDRKAALLLASLPPQKAAAIGRAALLVERSGH
jgi:hypothetical protein